MAVPRQTETHPGGVARRSTLWEKTRCERTDSATKESELSAYAAVSKPLTMRVAASRGTIEDKQAGKHPSPTGKLG